MIRGYQLTLSPFLGQNCRFQPSCSAYAAEAIERHGAIRGASMATLRLCRCHPFHPGGYDPVPDCPSCIASQERALEKGS